MKQLSLKLHSFRSIVALFLLSAFQVKSCGNWKKKSFKEEVPNSIVINTPASFHKAVEQGDLEAVKKILKQIDDVLKKKEKEEAVKSFLNSVLEETPLDKAIRRDFKSIALLLIQHPYIVLNKTGKGSTSLLLALECKNPKIAEMLLTQSGDKDLNLTATDLGSGETALHIAAKEGYLGVVKALLEVKNKIDVNAQDKNTDTPLHVAAYGGRIEVVTLLVKEGKTDVKAQGNRNRTPLHLAAGEGLLDIVELLLETKKDVGVNVRDEQGSTPLHLAAYGGHVSVVEALLKQSGIDVNAQDKNTDTPLHVAAYGGRTEVVNRLVKCTNIDVNPKNKDHNTPLHVAAYGGHTEVVERLVKCTNIDVNSKNKDDSTPLHVAALNGYLQVLKALLVHKDIHPKQKNSGGNTPIHLANQYNHQDCVNAIQQFLDNQATK